MIALALLPFAAWIGFCLLVNGHPLPTTYYVKSQPAQVTLSGLRAAWEVLTHRGFASTPLVRVGTVFFALAAWRRPRSESRIALAMLVASPVVFAAGVGGSPKVVLDGYYWTRWIDPASLVLTGALCAGTATMMVIALGWFGPGPLAELQRRWRTLRATAVVGELLSNVVFERLS